ncbi:hypothetical protein AMATHDRAFT_146966 [Amanita thiersii Skay4041]|uniref:GAF domain-containing protein n=1 Tax=Amanita thiersii Skay4041 TaxID=703135 RepID=A0A2A9NPZ2_9AGAR|nr:hypothetical protein AMATHDRAFT_146966 [Amanita thiersii Skay4041]
MPHADSALVPESIQSKTDFWQHVHSQLAALLEGQYCWISNLSNASSLIFNSLQAFPKYFGADNSKAVNWCGFYIHSKYFPTPRLRVNTKRDTVPPDEVLLLGPFCGKPACQFINISKERARGVCADAYIQQKTLVVPDVDQYPGHIACDGETKSEIVCPLVLTQGDTVHTLGVLDLDCLAFNGFDDEDRIGLEGISALIVGACNW